MDGHYIFIEFTQISYETNICFNLDKAPSIEILKYKLIIKSFLRISYKHNLIHILNL